MPAMTRHAQADLWHHGGGVTFAALFMEGEMRAPDNEVERTDVLLNAVRNRGLRLATDLPRLALGPRPGWTIRLDSAGALTLTWPHAQPLLLDAPLALPAGWPEAAAQHGLVLLFVGDSLGLRDHTEAHPTNPGQRAPQAAARGELAAGAITYSGTYSGQRQQPRSVHQADLQAHKPSSLMAPYTSVATSHDTLSTAHPAPTPRLPCLDGRDI